MLDRFGKLVRDIRITRSLLLYDMAKELDISTAELSAIETGKKPVPDWFIPALEKSYGIGGTCAEMLRFFAKNRGDPKNGWEGQKEFGGIFRSNRLRSHEKHRQR